MRSAVIVPSPLAGEGGSILPRAMMGEGFVVAATPHPFEVVGGPLCPLPQGARAREASAVHFGETNPTNPARSSPRKRGPIITVGGYGSRLSPRCREGSAGTTAGSVLSTNLRLYEMTVGEISLFPVVINNDFCNSSVSAPPRPKCVAPNVTPHMSPTMWHHPSSSQSFVIPCVTIRRHNMLCI